MNDYYILEQGVKKGPFKLVELKELNITPDTYVWTYGMDNWTEAKTLSELVEILQDIPPSLPPMPRTFLLPSILVTIFCCNPFGIIGIVKALNVSNAYAEGKISEAKALSEEAESVCYGTVILSLIPLLIAGVVILIKYFSKYIYMHI